MGGDFSPSQHLFLGTRCGLAGDRKQLDLEILHGTGEHHTNFVINKISK
jgi:hypothetical protein